MSENGLRLDIKRALHPTVVFSSGKYGKILGFIHSDYTRSPEAIVAIGKKIVSVEIDDLELSEEIE